MAKFIIVWDAGYGDTADIVEANSQDEADMIAYESWKEEAETNAVYSAAPYSEELAYDHGLEET